jgi:hypothetical protein
MEGKESSVFTVKTPAGCLAVMVAGVIVTLGFCRVLSEARERMMEELRKTLIISTDLVKSLRLNRQSATE